MDHSQAQKVIFGSEITLAGEGERLEVTGYTNKIETVPTNWLPYGYVVQSVRLPDSTITKLEPTGLRDDNGNLVSRFYCNKPQDVGEVRDLIGRDKTFEADISYLRRLFIDNVFSIHYWPERVVWLDIELDNTKGQPIVYGNYAITALSFSLDGKTIEHWDFAGREELDLLWRFLHILKKAGKTVWVAFNAEFDYKHIRERVKKLSGLYDEFVNYCWAFDVREYYKNEVKGLTTYSLAEIAEFEHLSPKLEMPTDKNSPTYEKDMREYNNRDVKILLELEQKWHFVEVRCKLHEYVNLPLSMDSTFLIGDTLILRRVHKLGFVAPNGRDEKNANYSGALVIKPTPGIYQDVYTLDFDSLYPNAVIQTKIDVGHFTGEVLPYLVTMFMKNKSEAGIKKDKIGRSVWKLLANGAGYGLVGWGKYRYFDPEKANKVTIEGVRMVTKLAKILTDMGCIVLYGDTDSIFFQMGSCKIPIEIVVNFVNELIKPYFTKLEHDAEWMILLRKEGDREEEGAKKRYILKDRMAEGAIFVRGMELRRSDWCQMTKLAIKDIVENIGLKASKESLKQRFHAIVLALFEGKYDSLLIMSKTVRSVVQTADDLNERIEKPREEWKDPTKAEYYTFSAIDKAFKAAQKAGKIPQDGNEITYLWVKKGRKPEPVFFEEGLRPCYDYYYERQLIPPIRRILRSIFSEEDVQYILSTKDVYQMSLV